MRIGPWGIGRWLAWTVLGVVIALCVAAFYGLGGWSSPLPPKPVTAHELPSPAALTPSMSEVSALAQIAQHSLFSPQRGMDNQSFGSTETSSEGQAVVDWTVISIVITPSLTVAVFTAPGQAPVRAKLGETVPGSVWRFTRAEPRAVILEGPSGERQLPLRTFDGVGAEQPQVLINRTADNPPRSEVVLPATEPTSTVTSAPPNAGPSQNSEAELRQRLAKRRAELQQQTTQGPKP